MRTDNSAKSARILLVDDTPTEQMLIGKWLEKHGFAVSVAGDGQEAVRWLEANQPDVVLTDLRMPDMDGLELTTTIRRRFSAVPVVLMTAHGSEDLAAKALQTGASSYVAKSNLKELLVPTLNDILNLSRSDVRYHRSFRQAEFCEMHFTIENDLDVIDPLVETIQSLVRDIGVCDKTGELHVGVALESVITNAIVHGNLEIEHSDANDLSKIVVQRSKEPRFADRKVHIQIRINKEEARFAVLDEGPGFDVTDLLKSDLPSSIASSASRSFVLMWALMDKVSFSHSGNKVTLIKTADTQANSPPDSAPTEQAPRHLGTLLNLSNQMETELPSDRLIIGRSPDCDIVVTSSAASRRHCMLFVYEGWWFVRCLKKTGSVRVNDQQVNQSRIGPGAKITIGDERFLLEYNLTDLGAVGITPPVDPF